MFKTRQGFTLIEMMVVIAIVGLLLAVVIVAGTRARQKARTSQALNDLARIQLALASYQTERGTYPSSRGGAGNWDGLYSTTGDSTANWIPGLTPSYMITLPRSPNNSTSGTNNYVYNSDGINYKLIWQNAEECTKVKSLHPGLIDPVRDCTAYGYWTSGATSW